MAKQNVTVKQGHPPFMPIMFPTAPLTGLSRPVGTQPNPYITPKEDGPGAYVNYDGLSVIIYNGQNQTGVLDIRIPKPV